MDHCEQLSALAEIAASLSVSVRLVRLGDSSGSGGSMARLKGQTIVFLNADASPADQLGVLAAAIRGRAELEDRFLPPELRELLERAD